MMLAELYGKAASKLLGSEDVLTSHAFGVLEVLEPETVLVPWLATARRADGGILNVPPDLRAVHFAYWPTFTHVHGKNKRDVKPDVLVTLDAPSGSILVLIEVKYRSGPSGYPTGPDESEQALKGQLGLQWAVLQAIPRTEAPGRPDRITSRCLLYLTADLAFPTRVLEDMGSEVTKVGLDPAAFASASYWLDWRRLGTALEGATGSGLLGRRLLQILDKRHLLAFAGCLPPRPHRVSWAYRAQATPFALEPPRTSRVPWEYQEASR